MKSFNNEIVIHRGESFTIDVTIQNKDGSPYIISKRLQNPYFLLTISSDKYEQNNRYVKRYWLDLADYPKFTSTQPVNLHDIKQSAIGSTPLYQTFVPYTYPLSGYQNGKYVEYYENDAVFYIDDENREYKYFNRHPSPIGIGDLTIWSNYECRLVKQFTSEDTKELVAQNYVYSIQLVTTEQENGQLKILSSVPILTPTKLTVLSDL